MGLYQEQSAFVAVHFGMSRKVICEPSYEQWKHLWAVSDLKSDDPLVLRRRIRSNVGEVAVQRHQNGIQLLSLCDDNRIIRLRRNMFLQDKDIMSCISKFLGD